MENLILLDTNILNIFTQDSNYNNLISFFKKEKLKLVIPSVTFVELYNPNPIGKDRTYNFSKFLSNIQFYICHHKSIWDSELKQYPKKLDKLIYGVDSKDLPIKETGDIKELFRMVFNNKLRKYNIDLDTASKSFENEKKLWNESFNNIISNAIINGDLKKDKYGNFIINNNIKNIFLQTLDLRISDDFYKIKEYLDKDIIPPKIYKKSLKKLNLIFTNNDTYKMQGIHLTSLLFWYDFIKQSKPLQKSDLGDFMNLTVLPYCKYAVIEKSRCNTLHQIQNQEKLYTETKVLNKKMFEQIILNL